MFIFLLLNDLQKTFASDHVHSKTFRQIEPKQYLPLKVRTLIGFLSLSNFVKMTLLEGQVNVNKPKLRWQRNNIVFLIFISICPRHTFCIDNKIDSSIIRTIWSCLYIKLIDSIFPCCEFTRIWVITGSNIILSLLPKNLNIIWYIIRTLRILKPGSIVNFSSLDDPTSFTEATLKAEKWSNSTLNWVGIDGFFVSSSMLRRSLVFECSISKKRTSCF